MGTDLVDGDSVLGWSYPNHVDRDIISEMRSAHGKDRQHATIVGRGIDRIVSRDPVIDSSRSVGVASYRPSFVSMFMENLRSSYKFNGKCIRSQVFGFKKIQ